jgi:cell division septation protein DedD
MSDEGFHEIQLNGKQLVFLFMAATVVSVVIFLCGVMVGRGVRAERGPEAVADAATPAPQTTAPETPPPVPVNPAPGRPTTPTASGAAVDPPPPADDGPVDRSSAKGAVAPPPSAPVNAPASAPKTAAAPPASEKPAAPKTEPPAEKKSDAALMPSDQSGWAVQVSAVRDRAEADAMARQLVTKGYQAYVLAPGSTGSPMFKVQIGRFKTKQDAEKTAARVKKEGKYKPWITR